MCACLSVCLCCGKCLTTFEGMDQFLELTRLAVAILWVSSTTAQSPQVRTCPISRPFPWSLSPLWSLMLPGHGISFWKAFDEANKSVIVDF